jgi:hypothetical protein
MSENMKRIFIKYLIVVTAMISTSNFVSCRCYTAIKGEYPDYQEQKVYGDSLSAFPTCLIYDSTYPFGMEFSPVKSLSFLPCSVLDDYWKTKHFFLFEDSGNKLVFEEYIEGEKVLSYPLIYASITDSRICLEENMHVGLSRNEALRILNLDSINENIQKICLTTGLDAAATFYFANDLLTRIVIRTDGEPLYNPDPIYEHHHAGQVRGYTGKRLYAVRKDNDNWLSSVGYVNEKGDTIVPYGRFNYCVSDSISPVGFVCEAGVRGITCINTEGEVMCHALVVDNFTPDYLFEGHFRIVNEEGLMGFADSLGHVTVKPQFMYAYPFQGGKAKVTYTGHKDDPNEEHWEWVSDDWFYINYKGRRVSENP